MIDKRKILRTPIYRWISKKINCLYIQIRRRYIYYTNREYIYESLKRRRGECKSCGKCCITTWKCPYVYIENGNFLCKLHPDKFELCKLYPFDEKDFFKHARKNCGYYFIKSEEES